MVLTTDGLQRMSKTTRKTPRRGSGRRAVAGFRRLKAGADLSDIKALYAEFIVGEWVGDYHTFWECREEGRLIAFCSALHSPETGCASLSSAVVVMNARGRRLQQRMIRLRVAWARRRGAHTMMTYVALRNYGSLVNLMRAGFRFAPCALQGKWQRLFHFMKKPLCSA